MAFLDGARIIYIDRVHGNIPHNTSYTIGSRAKACSTALGKAMLAYSPATVVENILSQGLCANTPYTITDPDQFRADLQHIAQGNCAIDNQENVLGICCIAAPIFDRKGEVVAALSISGLAVRLTDERLDEFSTHVMGASRAIS